MIRVNITCIGISKFQVVQQDSHCIHRTYTANNIGIATIIRNKWRKDSKDWKVPQSKSTWIGTAPRKEWI